MKNYIIIISICLIACAVKQKDFTYIITQIDDMPFSLVIKNGDEIHQKLDFQSTFPIDETWLDFDDWNHDGNADISIAREGGSGGEMYNIWLYDPSQDQFTLHEGLSSIVSPSIDTSTNRICGFWRGGWDMEQRDTFRFLGNNLIHVKSVQVSRWNEELPSEWVVWEKQESYKDEVLVYVDSCIISSWPITAKDDSSDRHYEWGERRD